MVRTEWDESRRLTLIVSSGIKREVFEGEFFPIAVKSAISAITATRFSARSKIQRARGRGTRVACLE
jgi:hypothetical protein